MVFRRPRSRLVAAADVDHPATGFRHHMAPFIHTGDLPVDGQRLAVDAIHRIPHPVQVAVAVVVALGALVAAVVRVAGGVEGLEGPAVPVVGDLFDIVAVGAIGTQPGGAVGHPAVAVVAEGFDVVVDPVAAIVLLDVSQQAQAQTAAIGAVVVAPEGVAFRSGRRW